MEILSQTVSFDKISATHPYSMHECTRMGQTVCYHYMVSIHVSPAQRGVSCDHVSGINLSPAHSAVKSADLYSPTLPSLCCRRLKNFGHQRGLAILQVASCCHTWHQGLDGISQPLELLIWNMVSSNRKYMHSSRHWCLRDLAMHTYVSELATLLTCIWVIPNCYPQIPSSSF